MANTKDLADSEPHPAAQDAMNWIKSSMSTRELLRWHEAFASNAIAGNRLAEVCVETCRRLIEGEPVSDRYLLGLAWAIRYGKSDLSSNAEVQPWPRWPRWPR